MILGMTKSTSFCFCGHRHANHRFSSAGAREALRFCICVYKYMRVRWEVRRGRERRSEGDSFPDGVRDSDGRRGGRKSTFHQCCMCEFRMCSVRMM